MGRKLNITGILWVCCWLLNIGGATAQRTNILLCIADDASLQHMGAYGFGQTKWVKTPAFDRVAGEGVLFTNAYTPNPKCAPSRASILTGRNPWQLEAAANHNPYFPAAYLSVMEVLDREGYHVGFTGKGWAPGMPGERNGQPRRLTGKRYDNRKADPPTPAISSTDYAANLEEFLKEKPSDAPFCFWYGSMEPHRRYEYGSGALKGGKKVSDIPAVPPYWPDNEQVRNDMLDYAFELEHFDDQLGKMLAVLEAHGELENTVVIVTSDNGMPFPRVKGHIYESASHLPLAIMWKKGIRNPGRKVSAYVSFIDFAPTLLELAGIGVEKSGMAPIQGQTLLPLLREDSGRLTGQRDFILLGRERQDVGRPNDEGYPVRGIVQDGFVYTRNYKPGRWPSGNPETGYMDTDGSPTKTTILEANRISPDTLPWRLAFGKRDAEELYNIGADPHCMDNLADDPDYAALKQQLRERMESELKRQDDPRMLGRGDLFDRYPYAQPKVRDFYNRYMNGEQLKAGWINETDFERSGALAPSPPMGWNSWNWFGKRDINEKVIREVIDAMVSTGLRDAGYHYVVIDGGWRDKKLGPNGELLSHPVRFPNGIKPLADYAHSKGLKIGLHTVPGTHDCGGDPVGGYGYEDVHVRQFVDWGVDFIKLDRCRFQEEGGWTEELTRELYSKWSKLIRESGRDMILNISAYQFRDWNPEVSQMSRTTLDIAAKVTGGANFVDEKPVKNFLSVMTIAGQNNEAAAHARPGYWNDPDMMVVGEQGLTSEEQKVHFALWCIMSSPLFLGNDPRDMTEEEKNIVLNKTAISINQDPTEQGTRIHKRGDSEIWAKELGDGSVAVLLLNRNAVRQVPISLDLSRIGISGQVRVQDVFGQRDLGSFSKKIKRQIPARSGVFLLIGPREK